MTAYREIEGLPGYFVGDDGSVRTYWSKRERYNTKTPPIRLNYWRMLEQIPHINGYLTVTICVRHYVHRLVLWAFVGPCPAGMQCRHLDGDRTNNQLNNLSWGTAKENQQDKERHGTNAVNKERYGEANGSCRLSDEEVQDIRHLRQEGIGPTELSRRFGVGRTHIKRILRGSARG